MQSDTAGMGSEARAERGGPTSADAPPPSRIIVVDGSAHTRDATRQLLIPYFDVTAVDNETEALAAMQGDLPDLLMADVATLGANGLDLVRTLRGSERTRSVPIILTSATADDDALVACLEAGANDYASGPTSPRALLARVRTQLAHVAERRSCAKQLRRATVELEEFVYIASHDLQEPLRMVRSYVQLLQKRYSGQLDADADVYIHYAVDGAARMQDLINDLLTLSRLDSEARPPVAIDMQALLDGALKELRSESSGAAATVTSGPLPVVTADERQLALVLGHLLSNAVKFRRPDVPACVHVSAERDGPAWIVSVRDNGIGIDAKHSARVFRMFQRLHTRAEYPGNGIGLPLCKKAIERAGGRIWLESGAGSGSTIHFTVRAAPTVTA